MTIVYGILFIVLCAFILHFFSKIYIMWKIRILKTRNPEIQNYLNDDSDEWLKYLLTNNENIVASYLYRKT